MYSIIRLRGRRMKNIIFHALYIFMRLPRRLQHNKWHHKKVLIKAPFIWRKVVPGKRVTLPKSTLASVYMRKKLTPLPEPRADRLSFDHEKIINSARACSDCLALMELTRLGEPKFLYGEKLPRLGG